MAEIVLKNISKVYDKGQRAVDNFSLHIRDGEFIVFVGPSSCGKSTTLRMIAGLEEISEGELWIGDELCNYAEPGEWDLSMVFQNYALYPQMSVYDNMAFSLSVRKVPKEQIARRVDKAAEMLDIKHLLNRRPGQLSGGQKQRVAIGSAIMREPRAFLMDEPLSNLDAKLRAHMRVELAALHQKLGATMIYVTHDQTEAMTLADRIVVMKEGRIQQVASPAELYSRPTNLLTSESFYNSILVTLIFVVIVVFGSMLLGLATAVLCSKTFPGIRVFSTAYALPMAIASSGAAMIFKVILNPTIGVFNKLTGLDINWISDPRYALICVAVLTAWLNSGINFLYFSAGLGNIDESIYERASVDGANSVQKFFRLTLPGLSPIIFYTLVVNIIQAFQSFGQVKILTQGGPGESTNLIVYSIYRDAFFNYKFGSAAAQSVILFLIIMALTLVMFKVEKKGVKY